MLLKFFHHLHCAVNREYLAVGTTGNIVSGVKDKLFKEWCVIRIALLNVFVHVYKNGVHVDDIIENEWAGKRQFILNPKR